MDKENPESLKELNAIKITGDIKDFVKKISSNVNDEKSARAFWDQNIDRYTNLRYGIRSNKNTPWPNCANYVIPQIDADINRIKPSYINLINVTPIVTFEPYGPEDIEPARKREHLFDWRMKTRVDFFEPYVLGVDYMLHQGAALFKVTWDYATRTYYKQIDLEDIPEDVVKVLYEPYVTDDVLKQIIIEQFLIDTSFEENVAEVERVVREFRDGKSEFELELVEEACNQPKLTACSIRDDVVFPVDTQDINQARFIDYIFSMPVNDIKIAIKDKKYEKYPDDVIKAWANTATQDTRKAQFKNRVYQGNDYDDVWLHETCVWYDVNNDGIKERCIVTWPDSNPSQVLRFIELPYDHGRWPYVLVKREMIDSGALSSRGIGALDEDFQNGISTFFNQSVDNGTITNTPIVKHKRNAWTNSRNLRYIPGQNIEINGQMTDVEVQQLGNVSQLPLLQAAQYLKSWADMRVGNITSGLTSPLNMQGSGTLGNKTKKEIDVVEALQSQVQSLDLQVFQEQMSEVYYQIDALYEQFGSDEEEMIITGEKPVKVSRQEIQGKFNIVPNGKLDNSNPVLRANKSFTLLRMFLGDPDIRQRDLKKLVIDDFDIKISKLLFKTDEEVAQEQQQQMQMQMQMDQMAFRNQVGKKMTVDDTEIRKAALMTTIEGRKYAPN